MITRPIKSIHNIPIKQFSVLDVDPHGQFIAIYLPNANAIHLIKTIHFTSSLLDFQHSFLLNRQYNLSIELMSDAQIPSKDLYDKHQVQKIVICPVFDSYQYLLVSNYFNIKIFLVQFQQADSPRIILKYQGQIYFHIAQPIHSFTSHQGQIWVNFLNGNMQIYKKINLVWTLKNSKKIKRQSIRLLEYNNFNHSPYSMSENLIENKITQKRKYPVGKESRRKKPINRKLSHYYENLQSIKLMRYYQSKKNCNKYHQIIYVSKENTLCQAYCSQTYPEYQLKQLCNNNKQPFNFNNKEDQFIFEKFKSQVPISYLINSSLNFIVCSESEGFSIISKHFGWRKILFDTMLPIINPFFEQFLITISVFFKVNSSRQVSKKASSFLLRNYLFSLVLFSKEDYLYKQTKEQEQKQSLYLELIAYRKTIDWNHNKTKQQKQIEDFQVKLPLSMIEAKRFKLIEFKTVHEDPEAIRWISPTQIIYFARKDLQKDHQMYYTVFKEDHLIQKISNVFASLFVDQLKKTKGGSWLTE